MDEKQTTEQEIAIRRAALFNVKVRNLGMQDILKHDYKKERELEEERERLLVILGNNKNIKDVDKMLLKPTREKKDEKPNNYKYRN